MVKRQLPAPHLRIRAAPAAQTELLALSNHVLECEAGGSPPPVIHWLKDGHRIGQVSQPRASCSTTSTNVTSTSTSHPRHIHITSIRAHTTQQSTHDVLESSSPVGELGLSFTRSRLYLDCVQPQDAATYTCVAENPFTRVSSDAQVKVIKPEGHDHDNSVALCLGKKSFGKWPGPEGIPPDTLSAASITRCRYLGSLSPRNGA